MLFTQQENVKFYLNKEAQKGLLTGREKECVVPDVIINYWQFHQPFFITHNKHKLKSHNAYLDYYLEREQTIAYIIIENIFFAILYGFFFIDL